MRVLRVVPADKEADDVADVERSQLGLKGVFGVEYDDLDDAEGGLYSYIILFDPAPLLRGEYSAYPLSRSPPRS